MTQSRSKGSEALHTTTTTLFAAMDAAFAVCMYILPLAVPHKMSQHNVTIHHCCAQAGPGMAVMDMCAAPGGKSLLLAQQIWATAHNRQFHPQHAPSTPQQDPINVQERIQAMALAHTAGGATQAESEPAPAGASTGADGQAQAGAAAAGSVSSSMAGGSSRGVSGGLGLGLGSGWAPPVGAARLVCNEPDNHRRSRLDTVLTEYLPPYIKALVQVTGYQADRWVGASWGSPTWVGMEPHGLTWACMAQGPAW